MKALVIYYEDGLTMNTLSAPAWVVAPAEVEVNATSSSGYPYGEVTLSRINDTDPSAYHSIGDVIHWLEDVAINLGVAPPVPWIAMTLDQIKDYLAGNLGVGSDVDGRQISEVRETENGVEYR